MSERFVHVDGEIVPSDAASVSVHDRGLRYGDGAFETLRAYGGRIFAWEDHAARLEGTCETLGFADALPPMTSLRDRVQTTLEANDLADAYVRLTVTRGEQAGKLTPAPDPEPTVIVVARPLPRGGLEGDPVWEEPAVLQTVRTRRIPDESLPADAKTLNYLNGIRARLELRRAATADYAADEAVMRDRADTVVEGATSNVFVVEAGRLLTPSADLPLLPGITRKRILELAREEDFPVETGRFDLDTLRGADEIFLTNTTWEVRPVTTVDGIEVERGPITSLLRRRYAERIEAACYTD
jgi:branched-chain amino acid aminotransferase